MGEREVGGKRIKEDSPSMSSGKARDSEYLEKLIIHIGEELIIIWVGEGGTLDFTS